LEKANVFVLNILFPILFLISFTIFLSFIYFFFGLMHDSLECVRNTVYSRLGSGDAGGDDDLRA